MSKQTPEEKLLSIIRKKETEKKGVQETKPAFPSSVSGEEKKENEVPSKAGETADIVRTFWNESTHKKFFFKELKNFRLEKQDLFLFIFLTVSVVLLNYYMGASVRKQAYVGDSEERGSLIKPLSADQEEAVSYPKRYGSLFSRKDIFTALPEKRDPIKPKEPGMTLADIVKDLKLLGIIWEDEGPKAIIESRKTRGTQYLTVGKTIDGAEVVNIEEGRVILRYGNETADLIL
ncbi:MAG: hypothetical protein JW928_02780 [Candidatus Aureabacteria bacterium]|nr:hypothetical protein [Candidatus Auribacterota bacterium]